MCQRNVQNSQENIHTKDPSGFMLNGNNLELGSINQAVKEEENGCTGAEGGYTSLQKESQV